MKDFKQKIVLIFYIAVFSFFPFTSRSENQINTQENDIIIDVSPQNPEPYQKVTINLTSYATDLNRAMIVWQRGSEIVSSGYGKTSYSFDGSAPDTSVVFDIKITTEEMISSINKRVFINFSEVILLWESVNGYVPPFYKGKSFVSKNGKIKIVAIPNTNKSNPGNFSYSWKLGDEVKNDISGYGKDYIKFNNNYLDSEEKIKVITTSLNGNFSASKEITIPIVSPFIVFYKKTTEDGVLYNKGTINEMSANQGENTIVATPYYLEYKGYEDDFNYQWKINDSIIKTPSKKTEITVRPTSIGGYSEIEVYFKNINNILQEAKGLLKLNL